MVCRGCEAALCSYSSPRLAPAGGLLCCDLLLKTIATTALLSPFLVHTLLQDELPDWTTLILTVLLPPLVLALTLSANSFFPGVPVINDDKQGKTKLPALKEMLK